VTRNVTELSSLFCSTTHFYVVKRLPIPRARNPLKMELESMNHVTCTDRRIRAFMPAAISGYVITSDPLYQLHVDYISKSWQVSYHTRSNRLQIFSISNFRHVLNVVCFLLGNSPASEFYMPTFRIPLYVPSVLYVPVPVEWRVTG